VFLSRQTVLCMSCYRYKERRRMAMGVRPARRSALLQTWRYRRRRLSSFHHQPVRRGSVGQGSLRACTLLVCSWPCFRLQLLGGTAAINKQSILRSPRVATIAVNTLSSHRPSDTALGPLTLWRRLRQLKTAVVPDQLHHRLCRADIDGREDFDPCLCNDAHKVP
jgi:hypothetical protein